MLIHQCSYSPVITYTKQQNFWYVANQSVSFILFRITGFELKSMRHIVYIRLYDDSTFGYVTRNEPRLELRYALHFLWCLDNLFAEIISS